MKHALDLEPVPWPFIVMMAAFLLYGLWPAVRPDHFRQTCLRYTRWPRVAAPADMIQLGAIVWVVMCVFGLVVGIASRL
jgi:hypothetical protein